MGNGISNVNVSRWAVSAEGGAAVPARVVANVVAIDGRVAAGVETVGHGTGGVEVCVGDVNYGVRPIGVDVCCAVVDCDIGVGYESC